MGGGRAEVIVVVVVFRSLRGGLGGGLRKEEDRDKIGSKRARARGREGRHGKGGDDLSQSGRSTAVPDASPSLPSVVGTKKRGTHEEIV